MMNKDNANKMKETMTFSVFAAFVLVTAFSYLVRDSIYERAAVDELQAFRSSGTPKELKPLPFIGESAKIACGAWRLSRTIDRPGAVADGDRRNDNLDGGEFLLARLLSYAYIAKTAVSGASAELATAESAFRNDEEFAKFIKTLFRFWAGTLSGLVFLCVFILTRDRRAALFGGGAHALTPAAVFAPALSPTPANFAVPLVAAAFIFGVWSVRRPGWRKTILSAAAFGVAVVFWKGAWTLFFFWGVAELIRLAAGGKITSAHKRLWLALNSAALAALAAVSMTRGISLFDVVTANPFILTGPAVLAAHWVPAKLAPSAPPLKTLLIFSVFVILWSLVAVSADSTAYFGDATRLLSVKASFFNVKPSDPALLAFSDRLLWNYAARSADVYAVRLFFPVVFVFSAIAVLSAAVSQRLRSRLAKWCFLVHPIPVMALAAFVAFLFFEDWHSVAAFFTSVFAGCALFFWLRNAKLLRRREGLAVLVAMLIGLTLCAFAQLGEPFSSGNILISTIISLQFLGVAAASAIITAVVVKLVSKIPIAKTFARLFIVASVITIIVVELQVQLRTPPYRVQNPETAVLLDWMSKENVVNTKFSCPPALAPLIETYAGARTLLPSRPWKSLESAEKYRKLLNLTYSGTEGELAELLAENKVEYLVFDLAAALSKSLFGPRYLAEAVDIPPLCPVTLMSSSQKRRKLKRFFEIRPPKESELSLKRFVVFKVVSRRNRSDAIKWALESERFAREGNTFMAARLAKSAIFADPNCDIADIMYRKLYGTPPLIRLRGF